MGCGCSRQPKDLGLSDTSCTMDGSSKKSDFTTAALASEADHATPSTLSFSAVDEEIERSKAHWSTLTEHRVYNDEEKMDFKVSNKKEFEALQRHHTWGSFFANFTGDAISTGRNYKDLGKLVIGKKFAQGAQAELYEAQIKRVDQKLDEVVWNQGHDYVVKVFKEGTLLKNVKSQLPRGLLQFHAKLEKEFSSHTLKVVPQYTSEVHFGILLKSGRFAFLMRKQNFDLRTLIERNMKLRSGEHCGPFSKQEAEVIMFFIALGVEWLHNRDIVHRDLKASNVLVNEDESAWTKWDCFVADYECSVGVVGTGFFRAPEILQACKERKVNDRPEVFSRAADVYSYGMTCYEILTGKLPFEDHQLKDNPSLLIDQVIIKHLRPQVPKVVDPWVRELLGGCWQFDPVARPTIEEILNEILDKSSTVRGLKVLLKKDLRKRII